MARSLLLVSAGMAPTPVSAAREPADALPEQRAIIRAAAGIGLYAGAFGLTFGAVATASGLRALQAVAMSVVMFTGASQFAFVGIVAVGGSAARFPITLSEGGAHRGVVPINGCTRCSA